MVVAAGLARFWRSALPDVTGPVDVRSGREQGLAHQTLIDGEMAQAIIDGALDAFVQTDERCVILNWSPHAEALMGWTRAEAVGRSVDELVFPEAQRAVHRQWVDRFLSEAEGDAVGGDTKRRCCTRMGANSSPRCR
ncbi:PAS domain S-box protein [Bradyrhizobium sp. RDT10]